MKISKILNQAEDFYKKALWSYFLKKAAIEEESYEMDPGEEDDQYDIPESEGVAQSLEDEDKKIEEAEDWISQQYSMYMSDDPKYAPVQSILREKEEEMVEEDASTPSKEAPISSDPKTIELELTNAKNKIKNEVAQVLIDKFIKAFNKANGLKLAFINNPEMTDKQFNTLIINTRDNFITALNDLNQNNFFSNPKKEDWEGIDLSPEKLRSIIDAAIDNVQNTISILSGEESSFSEGDGPEDILSDIEDQIKEDTQGTDVDDALAQQGAKKLTDAAKKAKERRARLKARDTNNEAAFRDLATKFEQGLIGQEEIDAARAEYVAVRKDIDDIERGKKEFDKVVRDHRARYRDIKREKIRYAITKSNPVALAKARASKAAHIAAKTKKFSEEAILDISKNIDDARKKHKDLEDKSNSLYEKEKDKPSWSNELLKARGDAFRQVEFINSLIELYKILKDKREHLLETKYKSNIRQKERRGKGRHISSSGTLEQIIKSLYEHPKNVEWGDIKKSVGKIKDNILDELDKAQAEIIGNFDKAISENKYAPLLEIYKTLVKARENLQSENESIQKAAKGLERSSLEMMTTAISTLLKEEISRQKIFSSWKKDVEKIVFLRANIERSYAPLIDLRVKLEQLKKLGIADQSNDYIIAGIRSGDIKLEDVENTLQKLTEYLDSASKLSEIRFLTPTGRERLNTKPMLKETVNLLKSEVERFSSLLNTLR